MRWLLLLLLCGVTSAVEIRGCPVYEFWSIGHSINHPGERRSHLVQWLVNNEGRCRSADYEVLWSRLGEWAGTADSAEIRVLIIRGYEKALRKE